MAQGLAGRGIRFVVTKGMTFESTLYGSLGTQHMNDIDFMIAPQDREAVMSAMQSSASVRSSNGRRIPAGRKSAAGSTATICLSSPAKSISLGRG